jgi:hypothetical protein
MMGVMVSPLRGADGNVEFLAHLRRGGDAQPSQVDAGDLIDVVVEDAGAAAVRPRGTRDHPASALDNSEGANSSEGGGR